MTLQQALNRLAEVLEQDTEHGNRYLCYLNEWIFDYFAHGFGIRRTSNKNVSILFYYQAMEDTPDFGEFKGLFKTDAGLYDYHFSVDDLLANDWECVLMESDGSFKETFNEFLRLNYEGIHYLSDIRHFDIFKTGDKFSDFEIIDPYTMEHYRDIEQDLLKIYNNGEDINDIVDDFVDKHGEILIYIDWKSSHKANSSQ